MRARCLLCFVVLYWSVSDAKEPLDDVGLAAVNGFMKMAFSHIDEADVKSLAVKLRDPFRVVCNRYGLSVVANELEWLCQSHKAELKVSLSRVNKLGWLVQRLANEMEGDDSDEDSEQVRYQGLRPGRTLRI
jgi:hypothetical protein